MQWNKRFFNNLNIYIPIAVFLLVLIGLVAISSAVEVNKTGSYGMSFLQTQIASIVLGIIAIIIIQFYDYSLCRQYYIPIFMTTIGLLLLTLVLGQNIAGGKRWISLGPVNFQPAELAKILVILVLARVLADNKDNLDYLVGFIKPAIFALIPFALIILQNDLGTALVLLFLFIVMLYIAGGNSKFMLIIFGGGFGLIVLTVVLHLWLGTPLPFLKEYQLNRLIVFANPDIDPYGIGYNILQSKIAIGSGMLFGKGLFGGTQNQLNFLPEKHTDFIFSVIGEEFGFIGVVIVLAAYLFLLWQFINVALNARDMYGRLVVSGITAMFFFHILENIGMTMGVMPITGIPLPFVSYGGSSTVTFLIAIGIVININTRKKKIMF